ncbi:hypothetical protein ACQPU1_09200 [Clostridium paraputrificum]|uniref:hypothetical protein n=1 Tax=Clostridium TaxID=1485 RepID=UPI003D33574B
MSNKKQHRTDGVIHSATMKFPASMQSYNTPTSDYSYTRGVHAKKTASQNPVY